MPVAVDEGTELPPPHAHSTTANSGIKRQRNRPEGCATAAFRRTRHPRMASAHSQDVGPTGLGHPRDRAVVLTLTLKEEADAPLTGTVGGTVQVAPVGTPVQVSEAVPLNPAPPMESA